MDETIVVPTVNKRAQSQFFRGEETGQKRFGNNQSAYTAFMNLKTQATAGERGDLSPKSHQQAESTEEDTRTLTPFQEKMLQLQLGNSGSGKSWGRSPLAKDTAYFSVEDSVSGLKGKHKGLSADQRKADESLIEVQLKECSKLLEANRGAEWRRVFRNVIGKVNNDGCHSGITLNKTYTSLLAEYNRGKVPGKLNFSQPSREVTLAHGNPGKVPESAENSRAFLFSSDKYLNSQFGSQEVHIPMHLKEVLEISSKGVESGDATVQSPGRQNQYSFIEVTNHKGVSYLGKRQLSPCGPQRTGRFHATIELRRSGTSRKNRFSRDGPRFGCRYNSGKKEHSPDFLTAKERKKLRRGSFDLLSPTERPMRLEDIKKLLVADGFSREYL